MPAASISILLPQSGEAIIGMASVCLSVTFLCLIHNFYTAEKILKYLGTNNHHYKTMCKEQQLGPYLKGQGLT